MGALLERIANGPIMSATIARGSLSVSSNFSDNFAHLLDSSPAVAKKHIARSTYIKEGSRKVVPVEPATSWWSKIKDKATQIFSQPVATAQQEVFREHSTSKRWFRDSNPSLRSLSSAITTTVIASMLPGLLISYEVNSQINPEQGKNQAEASAPANNIQQAVTTDGQNVQVVVTPIIETIVAIPMPEYEIYETQGGDYLFKLFDERGINKDMRALYEFMRLNDDYFDVSKIKDKEFFNGHDVNRMFKEAKKLKPGMQLKFVK